MFEDEFYRVTTYKSLCEYVYVHIHVVMYRESSILVELRNSVWNAYVYYVYCIKLHTSIGIIGYSQKDFIYYLPRLFWECRNNEELYLIIY